MASAIIVSMGKNIFFTVGTGVLALLLTWFLQYVTYHLYDLTGHKMNSYVENPMGFIQAVVLGVSVLVLLKITQTSNLIHSVVISVVIFTTFFVIESLMYVWPYLSSDLNIDAGEVFSARVFGIGVWFLLLAVSFGVIYNPISKTKLAIQCLIVLIFIIGMSSIFNSYNSWISTSRSSDIDWSKSLFLQHIKYLVG